MAKVLSFNKHSVSRTTSFFHFIIKASGLPHHDYFPHLAEIDEDDRCLFPIPNEESYMNIYHIPGSKPEFLKRTCDSKIRSYKLQKPGFKNVKLLVTFNPNERHSNGLKVFHYYLLDDYLNPIAFDDFSKIIKHLTIKKLSKIA